MLFTSVSPSLTKGTYKKCSTEPHYYIFMILFVTLYGGLALKARVLWVRSDKGPTHSLFCLFLDGFMQGKCRAGRYNNTFLLSSIPSLKSNKSAQEWHKIGFFILIHLTVLVFIAGLSLYPKNVTQIIKKQGKEVVNSVLLIP